MDPPERAADGCRGVARGVPRAAAPRRQGTCGGDAILEPEPRPGVDAQARCSRAARARRNTAYHIVRLSFPVLVFCRLGWYDAIKTLPSGRWLATPCPNGGRSPGASRSHHPAALSQLSCAMRPSVTTTRTPRRKGSTAAG